jgi:hypothetical protein
MTKQLIIPKLLLPLLFLAICFAANAQETGRFSGGFQSTANLFLRDSLIGADNIPQYDNEFLGAEAWLDLSYSMSGFTGGIRFDLFNNSNLRNPNTSYTAQGLGRYYLSKEVGDLTITAGHIYDQIGSGIIFRAFEARPQLIDNALLGVRASYKINQDWSFKAFTGRQKILFDTYSSTIRGANLDGYFKIGEESPISFAPGLGFINRTLSDEVMNSMVGILKGYLPEDRFSPQYNVYLGSFYNTMSFGPITWYTETGYKTSDAFFDGSATKAELTGTSLGKFVKDSGTVFYNSVSYAGHGLGVTLEAKRTENFNFRVDPILSTNLGLVNYIPAMNRENSYRLTTRYQPATQDLSELAFQADAQYRIKKNLSVAANFSNISTLENKLLYQELYTEVLYKHEKKWTLKSGVQVQSYNQEVYEVKPEVPVVKTVVPYADFLYKLTKKKSIRTELQYMRTGSDEKGVKHDYGDWLFALVEVSFAPHWSFTVSDMYNASPGKNSPTDSSGKALALHYPRIDVFYVNHSNRYSLSYIKQVEGIVCTGGICRLEPAFSGMRLTVSSTF